MEMQNADEVVEYISEDGSRTFANQGTDGPVDEEKEDHSMSKFHTEPAEYEDEEQDNEQENEQTNDMPKTNPTFDVAKETIAPSTETTTTLTPEKLEALKQSKSVEYLKVIISAMGSSTEKSPSTSTVLDGQSTSKYSDNIFPQNKRKSLRH